MSLLHRRFRDRQEKTVNKYLVTMGGKEQGYNDWNGLGIHRDYNKEAERLVESAKPYGLISTIFDNEYLFNSKYYSIAKDVLDAPQFAGAFKGIILFETLKNMDDGDFVYWVDSNHVFVNDAHYLSDVAKSNHMFIHTTTDVVYPNKNWTVRDMFVGMGADEERYWNAPQMQVSVMCFCKTPFTERFIEELLLYSLDYDTMVGRNVYPNFPTFRAHRREQSVISILMERYHIKYYKEPKQYIPEVDAINAV